MIRCHLGDKIFIGGIKKYLEDFKYKNPTSVNLFQAWDDWVDLFGSETRFQSENSALCNGIGASTNGAILPYGKSAKETFDPWLRIVFAV